MEDVSLLRPGDQRRREIDRSAIPQLGDCFVALHAEDLQVVPARVGATVGGDVTVDHASRADELAIDDRQLANELEAEGTGLFPSLAERGRREALALLDGAGRELDAGEPVIEHQELRPGWTGARDERGDLPDWRRPCGHGAITTHAVWGGDPQRRVEHVVLTGPHLAARELEPAAVRADHRAVPVGEEGHHGEPRHTIHRQLGAESRRRHW